MNREYAELHGPYIKEFSGYRYKGELDIWRTGDGTIEITGKSADYYRDNNNYPVLDSIKFSTTREELEKFAKEVADMTGCYLIPKADYRKICELIGAEIEDEDED